MIFTVGDQIINNCWSINEKYEVNHFLKMFPDTHHHHHIRFWYLWCCGCPRLRGRQHLTLVLHEFLSNGLIPSRLHIVISFLTHADHVFLGLPRFLVPGTPNRVFGGSRHPVFYNSQCTTKFLEYFGDDTREK